MGSDSHIEIAYSSIRCFTDDGTLDLGELNFLMGLALRDGEVDDEEKRVLRSIFSKVSESDVNAETWNRIKAIRSKYSI
jgi:hypothetical protein